MTSRISAPPGACRGRRRSPCVCRRASRSRDPRAPSAWHFKRGFNFPASSFFRNFLELFGLQPHHLGAGAIVQLYGFVTLCEGNLGVEPSIDLLVHFFSLKQQGPKAGEMSDCGAAVFRRRAAAGETELWLLSPAPVAGGAQPVPAGVGDDGAGRLIGTDLIIAFIRRRVLPLR